MNILVTGGCGYIGSHTIVNLLENNFNNIYCIDNLCNSNEELLNGIKKITAKQILNNNLDLCNFNALEIFFLNNKIDCIIHFAALKSVPDSVKNSNVYYQNNIIGLLNLLNMVNKYNVKQFIFSSSCSVYGNVTNLPVTENTKLETPQSPYAATKYMGELIIKDFAKNSTCQFIALRYFNPVGAHQTALIGELPNGVPQTILPVITQAAIGLIKNVCVFGTNYNTKDGTCIRDFIHVSDIAYAHTLALKFLLSNSVANNFDIFNLGTGNGISILEVINTFEEVNKIKVPIIFGEPRLGDVVSIYANNDKAKSILKWNAIYNLENMVATAWQWQLKLKSNQC